MRETEGLIQQGLTSTPEDEYKAISQGVDDYKGLLTKPDSFNKDAAYGNEAMSNAIRSKYSKPYQVQMQGLDNKLKLDARNAHFEKIRTAHQLANEEANLNFQKEVIKWKKKQAKQAQRQALAGSVLGLVGGVVGTAYGGAAGGAAGSQTGNIAQAGGAQMNQSIGGG